MINFLPGNEITVDFNEPRGTRIAQIEVSGLPEGHKVGKIQLLDNADRRIQLNGTDVVLAKNLTDDSDMVIVVETEIAGGWVKGTLTAKVKTPNQDAVFEVLEKKVTPLKEQMI